MADTGDPLADRIAAEVTRQVRRFRAAAGGVTPRHCPLCDHRGLFTAYGHPPRYDARCPACGSLERHRLIALFLGRTGFVGPGHAVLHVAPEPQLAKVFRAVAARYETADIDPSKNVTHHVPLEDTGLPAASFDRIVCNHVLEHVDDRAALAEIRRLLVPGGRALLTTPVIEGWAETHEDAGITTREGRLLHFGQGDHVRLYGRDLRDRIRAAGLALEEVTATEPDVARHGLIRGETLFIATRPGDAT